MFHTILVPTDGSEHAQKAVLAAVDFAKASHGKVIGLSVAEPYPFSPLAETGGFPDPLSYERATLKMVQRFVEKVADAANKAGVPCETVTAMDADPAGQILKTADRYGCDAIFMATHGRHGLNKLILGSVTEGVLLNSPVPVVVYR